MSVDQKVSGWVWGDGLRGLRRGMLATTMGLALAGVMLAGCSSSQNHDGYSSQSASKGKATYIASGSPQGAYAYPQLPKAIASFGAVESDGYLYVYGGHQVKAHTYNVEAISNSFYRLNLDDPKGWEVLPSGPRIQGMNLAAWNGHIIRTGGMEPRNQVGEKEANYSITSAQYYDVSKGKWIDLPDLPEPRSSHDMAVVNDKLYVFGGWNMNAEKGDTWFTTGLELDLTDANAKWKIIDQAFVRRALIMASHDEKVWVLGGMDDGNQISQEVDIFDPATGQWSKGPKLPGGMMNGFSPAAVVADDTLYVSTFDGALHRLSRQTNQWEKVIQATPRIVHRMVSHDDSLVLVGGAAGRGKMLDLVETVTLTKHGARLDVLPAPQAPSFNERDGRSAAARRQMEQGENANPHAAQNPHAGGNHHANHHANPHGENPHAGHGHHHAKPDEAGEKKPASTDAKTGTEDAPQASAKAAATDAQKVCPVMTGAQIGSVNDVIVTYEGKEVRLCCEACLSKWLRDKNAYLLPEHLPQLAGLKLPDRGIEQVYCPVYKDRVVSSKDPSVQYKGKTIYLYSHSAVRRWNADPEKYADPKILPQLAQQ